MSVSLNTLFQNCIIGFAPLNRRVARAPDKKFLKRLSSPEPLTQVQNNFTELFLLIPYNGYALLNKKAARAPDKKYIKTAFPPEPLVQIQNNFTGFFLKKPSSNIAQMVPVH